MTTRRILLLLAVAIPSLAAAIWIGVALAQTEGPAKALDGLKYPGATQLGSGGGPGRAFMVQATSDGLGKVLAFYGKKVGARLTPEHPGGMGFRSDEEKVSAFLDDSVQPGPKAQERPVAVHIAVQRTKDHFLTLVISRAKTEDQTHISLTYVTR